MNPDTTAQLRQKLAEIVGLPYVKSDKDSQEFKAKQHNAIMQAIADYISQLELPKPIAIVEIPDFPESRLFAEAYAKGQAKGFKQAIDDTVSTLQKAAEALRS